MSVANGIVSAPIAHTDPYTVLGIVPTTSGAYDVAEPQLSTAINKWSFAKPVEGGNYPALSNPEGFYSLNDGFSFATYTHPAAAIQSMITGDTENWKYTERSTTSWRRQTDWEGYNHNSECWFNLTFSKTSMGVGDTVTVRTNRRGFVTSGFLNFAVMSAYKGSTSAVLAYGLIFQKKGTSSPDTAIFYKYATNISIGDKNDEADFEFTVPSTVLKAGEYYVMPAVTTYTNLTDGSFTEMRGDTEYGTWWAFPAESLQTITIAAVSTSVLDKVGISCYARGGLLSGTTYYFEDISVELSNSTGGTLSGVQVMVKIIDYMGGTIQPSGTSAILLDSSINVGTSGATATASFAKNDLGYISVEYVSDPIVEIVVEYGDDSKSMTINPFE